MDYSSADGAATWIDGIHLAFLGVSWLRTRWNSTSNNQCQQHPQTQVAMSSANSLSCRSHTCSSRCYWRTHLVYGGAPACSNSATRRLHCAWEGHERRRYVNAWEQHYHTSCLEASLRSYSRPLFQSSKTEMRMEGGQFAPWAVLFKKSKLTSSVITPIAISHWGFGKLATSGASYNARGASYLWPGIGICQRKEMGQVYAVQSLVCIIICIIIIRKQYRHHSIQWWADKH